MKTKTYTVDAEGKRRILDRIRELLSKRVDVLFAYVHGSFITELPFHDIDVAVYLAGATEATSTLNALELSQQISDELNRPVDVRALNFASIPFRYQAIRGQLLLEKNENQLAEFIEHSVQRYLDIEPLLRTGAREAFAA